MERRTWVITGIIVPLVAATIAAIPLWLEVIRPRIDHNSTPTPTVVAQPTLPDQNAINVALLTESDLPEGWVVSSSAFVEEPCGVHYRRGELGASEGLGYPDDPNAPFMYHEVSAFDPGQGKIELDSIISTIDACPSSKSMAPDGQNVDSIIDPFALPQLGDQSYGFRETVPGFDSSYYTDTIIIRFADVLSILIVTTTEEPDDSYVAFVDTTAHIAESKLEQALYP